MKREETSGIDKANIKRGRLKVFIGALPGVGKTYRMLSEATRRIKRGQDVVVGLIEPHGRPETENLAAEMERIPLKEVEYRGKLFNELNTREIIRRKPTWVLVDELAHTNIPGTEHEKRWQSVQEILEHGINVATTVNIQHLESLRAVIFNITGIQVHETVPDFVVDQADEIELVDITPDALINRLKRGDIYHQEKITDALSNFFRKSNVVALRELALRLTAEEVDQQLHDFEDLSRVNIHEMVVVAVTAGPRSDRLIRRGYRLSKRMQAGFTCIYVRPAGVALSKSEEDSLQVLKQLANNMGGEVVELIGDNVAGEIINYITTHQTTILVLGQSARSRFEEIVTGSIVNKIMRQTRNIDIVVVADTS